MAERPLVSVERRLDGIVIECSACGDVSDQRQVLEMAQRAAFQHSELWHDGDVDRQGWK